jgi:hypothetical protein
VLDATTGEALFEPFVTGDLIKGSVSVDPDGYPLLYVGSRDDYFRIISFDGGELRELWEAVGLRRLTDHVERRLGRLRAHRGRPAHRGAARTASSTWWSSTAATAPPARSPWPRAGVHTPGWDEDLLADFGARPSPSRGRWPGGGTSSTSPTRPGWSRVGTWALWPEWHPRAHALRFWTGDDTDASVVIDDEGQLYVASQYEVGNERARQVGQLVKLDPRRSDDPLVWSVPVHDDRPDGIWATPALPRRAGHRGHQRRPAPRVDRATGRVRWRKELPGPTWQSPVVVDDVLVQGDCRGFLHGFDLRDPLVEPPELWRVELAGASSRPPPCGGAASTWARGPAPCSPCATPAPDTAA